MGAIRIIRRPVNEFVVPMIAVLSAPKRSEAQYDLKKIGKKPAITVVAKAELAQS